jgi:uncharacterized protein
MITKISEVELTILKLFTQGYSAELHLRGIEKKVPYSFRTVQITMEKLEQRRVVISKMVGKNKMYELQKSLIAKEYCLLTERYKKISFLEQKPFLRGIIEFLEPHLSGIVVIFGSYAKNLEKPHSDLDVFIAGTCDEEEITKISKRFGIHISLKIYPIEIFVEKIHSDYLLNEIVHDHIILKGAEHFVGAMQIWKN